MGAERNIIFAGIDGDMSGTSALENDGKRQQIHERQLSDEQIREL